MLEKGNIQMTKELGEVENTRNMNSSIKGLEDRAEEFQETELEIEYKGKQMEYRIQETEYRIGHKGKEMEIRG